MSLNANSDQVPASLSNFQIFDSAWEKVLFGLSEVIRDNISKSAEQTLDISCQFFENDVSDVLTDFQHLYLENPELDKYKNAINDSVDDLFDKACDPHFKLEDLADSDIDQKHASERDSLAALQKDLEALVTQDTIVKERLVPVMQSMQYEDIVINQIRRLTENWRYAIAVLNQTGEINYADVLKQFLNNLSTEDEVRFFYKHVLRKTLVNLAEEELIPLDDRICDHKIWGKEDLMERFVKYSNLFLTSCIAKTQRPFEELMHLMRLANKESDEMKYLFSNQTETFDSVMAVIEKYKSSDSFEMANKLQSLLDSKQNANNTVDTLVHDLMVTMQAQDSIHQYIENMIKLTNCWWEIREDVPIKKPINSALWGKYKTHMLANLSLDTERNVIKSVFQDIHLN